jgi:protein-tyrosine phosphatase
MRHSAVHVLASDAHGVGSRPPILSDGFRAAEKILGKHAAEALVSDTPRAIVRGESMRRGLGASNTIPKDVT